MLSIEQSDLVTTSNYLTIEIISVKGLIKDYSSIITNYQIHVIFDNQSHHSNYETKSADGNEDLNFQFQTKFPMLSDMVTIKNQHLPINFFLTKSLSNNSADHISHVDFQPVGFIFSSTLAAQAVIDSRLAFFHQKEFLSVELVPCNTGGVIDTGFCGVIFIRLGIEGPVAKRYELDKSIEMEQFLEGIEKTQKIIEKMNYDQYQELKTWYTDCRIKYPYIEERKIKLISLDECGRHRMVSNFIGSVTPSRLIDSPRFSARMVSLIPFHRSVELIGGNLSNCYSPFTTLMKLQGDIEDHAILLCSLLMGWGLDAYVAYGSIFPSNASQSNYLDDIKQPTHHFHYWVVTLDNLNHDVDSSSPSSTDEETDFVTFWEPLTGQQFKIFTSNRSLHFTISNKTRKNNAPHHPFRYLFALFRHDVYYLNIQINPSVSDEVSLDTPMASLDLLNKKYWSSFPNRYYDFIKHPGANLPLPYRNITSMSNLIQKDFLPDLEIKIETSIMNLIRSLRLEIGLMTYFEPTLAIKLQPALIAYELDRVVGVTFGNEDFQTSIKHTVSKGECFRAYPTCFSYTHIPSILSTLSRTVAFKDLILSGTLLSAKNPTSNSNMALMKLTKHAVRVKIITYSENLCAVWVIVAVCYKKN